LTIFGDDYNTPDGTCIRDYIHVLDLGEGHVKALDRLFGNVYADKEKGVFEVFNLGTGHGTSVHELVSAFEATFGFEINKIVGARRSGDIAVSYAITNLANEQLNFKPQFTIAQMCSDSWNWQQKNPNGFSS
jgi:UDP-glucose 4-epimerase